MEVENDPFSLIGTEMIALLVKLSRGNRPVRC